MSNDTLVPETAEEIDSECPVCSGGGVTLGGLGWTIHYRCRDCGIPFHHDVRPKPQASK